MKTAAAATATLTAAEVERLRADFPALSQTVHGKPLVYLDNAATTQKPQAVIDAIVNYYARDCSNIHRGLHQLSERATASYEGARQKAARHINAPDARQIVFVRGTTEAINLVTHSWGRPRLKPGDEIVISTMEHHSNIVPWQLLCEATGATLRVIPISDEGELQLDAFEKLLSKKTRLVSVVHVSNALGTINPIRRIVEMSHAHGALVMVDGAQAAAHIRLDMQQLDCDFYAFSSHKIYGPTGVGVLYGKADLLESMPPYQGGGDMISTVTFEKTTWNKLPHKFEAGTPDIAGVIGLGAALDYLHGVGIERAAGWEADLQAYATSVVGSIPGVTLVGRARHKASIVSFTMDGIHPHDIGTILDQEGIAVRAGHHCTQPLMERYHVPATARASFAFYNTRAEIDALARGIHRVREVMG